MGLEGRLQERLANLFAVLFFLFCGLAGAYAQGIAPSSSYITPFPQGDRYRIARDRRLVRRGAYGRDSRTRSRARLRSMSADLSRSGYGLVRLEQSGLLAEVDKMLSGAPVHIVVVMLGMNDRLSIKNRDRQCAARLGRVERALRQGSRKTYQKAAERERRGLLGRAAAHEQSGQNEFVAGINDSHPASRLSQRRQIRRDFGRASPIRLAPTAPGEPTFPGRPSACAKATARGSPRPDTARLPVSSKYPSSGIWPRRALSATSRLQAMRRSRRAWCLSPRATPPQRVLQPIARNRAPARLRLEGRDRHGGKPDPGAKTANAGAKTEPGPAAAPDAARRDQAAFARNWQPVRRVHPGRAWQRPDLHSCHHPRGRFVDARDPKADTACGPSLFQGSEQGRSLASKRRPRRRFPLARRGKYAVSIAVLCKRVRRFAGVGMQGSEHKVQKFPRCIQHAACFCCSALFFRAACPASRPWLGTTTTPITPPLAIPKLPRR